ncbi:hypothetical protein [Micromonospora lupini]|uniref:Uncharacterized protein n=1 Tax=Micromonospora lupini str. Lupac 08 TaxID=1150864 RepID=I0L8U0_9ACTN|nr:hypothetical protein [Micromonospora lupini]CCH20237.1 conserved exported hypothetical protein [Micromonospora lupini str. Lupac 08]
MIVASLLLILVAVVLLVFGLAGGSSILLTISIAASLLAAVALVAGARQAAANRATADPGRPGPRDRATFRRASQAEPGFAYGPPLAEPDVPVQHVPSTVGNGGTGWRQPPEPPSDPDEAPPSDAWPPHDAASPFEPEAPFVPPADGSRFSPVSPASPFVARGDEAYSSDAAAVDALADEPAEQPITPAEAARVSRLPDPVVVVDGRPRYHLAGCPHLAGRVPEPLPVAEAVELGFTPCAACAPATALLTDARPI